MKEKKLCLDLCAGLGGFSRAFKDREDWEIVTVDINPKFNTTMVLDLINVVEHPESHEDFWSLKPDVIVASPPCEHFSHASPIWPREGVYNGMKVAGAVLEIIAKMKPKGYIVENPTGKLRWMIGKPMMHNGLEKWGYASRKPTDFWTNIDMGIIPIRKASPGNRIKFNGHDKSVAARIAEMPYGLSKLVLESFEEAQS